YAECGGAEVTGKLMGNWQSVRFDGETLIRPNGGTYHANPRDNFLQAPCTLDPARAPRGITIKESDGVTTGSYVLKEDLLILRLYIGFSTRNSDGAPTSP